jgi:adenylate cyclase class 2
MLPRGGARLPAGSVGLRADVPPTQHREQRNEASSPNINPYTNYPSPPMTETEIKLPVANVAAMRRLLRRLGWRVSVRRHLEHNLVFDRPDGSLLAAGSLLRLRSAGKLCLLTVKRPMRPSALHKVREEFEIETTDTASATAILGALDYQIAWRYEKYRTQFTRQGAKGKILLDETPIGNYLELEGDPGWIDATAIQLGFGVDDYITASYRGLFVEQARGNKKAPRDMVFPARKRPPKSIQ